MSDAAGMTFLEPGSTAPIDVLIGFTPRYVLIKAFPNDGGYITELGILTPPNIESCQMIDLINNNTTSSLNTLFYVDESPAAGWAQGHGQIITNGFRLTFDWNDLFNRALVHWIAVN